MTYPSYNIKSLPVYGNQLIGHNNNRQAFIFKRISNLWIKGVLGFYTLMFLNLEMNYHHHLLYFILPKLTVP
jgi:hypothetical protein